MKRRWARALKSSLILHSKQLWAELNWIVVSTFVLTTVIDLLLKMRHPMDTMAGHAVANLLLSLAVLVLVHSVASTTFI